MSQSPAPPSRSQSALIVFAIVAFPLAFVAVHRTPSVQASPLQAAGPSGGTNLADLEHLAQSDPTMAHRLNLSQAYINGGQTGRAVQILNGLVAEDAHNGAAWSNLCVAHTLQQEYDKAIPACEAGVRADGSVQLFKNNLKWAQDEKAKVLAALSAESRASSAERTSAFYVAEGLNHMHIGEYTQALASWQRSLELDPSNAAAQNNIGTALMLQGKYAEAEAAFRKAISMDPGSQLARNNLSWALSEKQGARQ